MDSNYSPEARAEATATFERDLTELVVAAFAGGAAVEGTWDVAVPVSDAPDWSVTIDRCESGGPQSYDPEFLDE